MLWEPFCNDFAGSHGVHMSTKWYGHFGDVSARVVPKPPDRLPLEESVESVGGVSWLLRQGVKKAFHFFEQESFEFDPLICVGSWGSQLSRSEKSVGGVSL